MSVLEIPELPPMKVGANTVRGRSYYYMQTYTHHYDKTLKRNVRDSQKTVGTIANHQKYGLIIWRKEFLEQYPALEHFNVYKTEKGLEFKAIEDEINKAIPFQQVKKLLGGATWAINKALAQTGIGDALKEVFYKYRRDLKIASLINYMVIRQSCVMHNYEPFSKTHHLPWFKPLNDAQIHNLFKSITHDDLIHFFNALNRQIHKNKGPDFYKNNLYAALDSTSISTYSNLGQAEYGYNKDGDTTKQINCLMVCEQNTGMPIYAKTYKGNVVDVTTVEKLLTDLEVIFNYKNNSSNIIKPNIVFVTDRGYDSINNMHEFLRHDYHFLIKSKLSAKWILDIVDESRSNLLNDNNFDIFYEHHSFTQAITYKYDKTPINGKNKCNDTEVKIYVHIYYDENIYQEKYKNLRFNITNAKEEYNQKVDKLYACNPTPTAQELTSITIDNGQNFIDLYCCFDNKGYALIDANKIQKKLKNAGVMVLISDTVTDAREAYAAYKNRYRVERNFEVFKSTLNFNRPYNSNDRAYNGKFLCQFIATAIAILFETRIKNYEKTLEAKNDKVRFNCYSLSRIIDELNTIMLTMFKGGFYFDEIAGKYKTLYKALEIPLPESQYKYETENFDSIDEEPYESQLDLDFQTLGGEFI